MGNVPNFVQDELNLWDALLLAQGLIAGRIGLRLSLWAGQIALLRRFAAAPWPAASA